MLIRAFLDAIIPAAAAHEKWFVSENPAAILPPQFVPGSLPFDIASGAVIVVCVAGFLFDKAFEHSAFYARTEKILRPWRDLAPGILAVSTAVLLLWSAWKGVLLADNYPLPAGTAGTLLRIAETAVGGMFLVGFGTATAAVGLGLLYASVITLFGLPEATEYLYLAAIAVFLMFFARGRYSLDWFYGKPVISTPEGRKKAYLVMRILTGFGFLALALLKWRQPGMHLALMDEYDEWNPYVIAQWFGAAFSRETYVLILAAVETTVAVWVIGGFLTRAAALFLMPVFIGSIFFLGPMELVGHLPILGILVVLFVYGDTYHKHAVETPPPQPGAARI
jgi:uncharacterized membrane protein YphA (DoxX/SURF4 family)